MQITTTDRTRLTQAKDLFATGKLAQAVAIREIFDKKLYKIEGYENRDDYCQDVLQISPAQGKILYKVATSFGLTMDTLKAPKSQPVSFLNDANEGEGNQTDAPSSATSIQSLPITTLYELSRLQDEERDILTKEGYLFDAEGNKITLSEVRGMTKRQMQEMMREKTSKLRERAEALAEDNLELKNTVERLKTENKILTQKTEIAAELEEKFGSVARRLEEKRRYIADAKRLLAEAHDRIVRAGITPQDAVTDIQEISNFLGQLDLTANIVRNHYMPAIEVLISHS
ncbi:MAG: hypothetical protein J0L94_01075 [Rhodothermia bacterium]|nr:hypothetical protein [Rhodothermia bacterium]